MAHTDRTDEARPSRSRDTSRDKAHERRGSDHSSSEHKSADHAKTEHRASASKARDHGHRTDERAPGSHDTNVNRDDAKYLHEHEGELSKSTLRARWIHSPNEHEDHPGQTLATRSHEVIQHWADERQAQPATVPGTEHGGRPGVLRFNFPGYGGQSLQAISWDDWFKTFDERDLVFLFQEHQRAGNQSNFFHMDSPEREHD